MTIHTHFSPDGNSTFVPMHAKASIEVFKTNICDPKKADLLLKLLHAVFPQYQINFDLEDTDRILRVENPYGAVKKSQIIKLIQKYGYEICILPD